MFSYTVSTMILKDDVLDEEDRIYDEALDYLIERSNTLAEIEYMLATTQNTQSCLEKAIFNFNDMDSTADEQKAITLMTMMNILNEHRHYKSICEETNDILEDEEEDE